MSNNKNKLISLIKELADETDRTRAIKPAQPKPKKTKRSTGSTIFTSGVIIGTLLGTGLVYGAISLSTVVKERDQLRAMLNINTEISPTGFDLYRTLPEISQPSRAITGLSTEMATNQQLPIQGFSFRESLTYPAFSKYKIIESPAKL